ncbi:dye-decolorizing peroxidase precursor [Mycena leptocephala]|nr:dye-decolorizing peroxidase precursor [Mycena leptocephala]
MRLDTSTLIFLGLCAGIVSAARLDAARSLQPRRKTSMLIAPAAQPGLPSINAAKAASAAANLNLDDIQGDILFAHPPNITRIGMKKKKELFFFFGISKAAKFKRKLKSHILPLVTSTTKLLDISSQPTTALNIAFSQTGLLALNVSDPLNDAPFAGGQLNDSSNLATQACRFRLLGRNLEPAVVGFQTPLPGQAVVPTGEILVGETGDNVTRPLWAKDGSFLVFRQLKQLVPEFDKFLTDNPIRIPALTPKQGSDLLGARMIGRWKSGAPVMLAPLVDNPALGADPTRNNNFTYGAPGQTTGKSNTTDQSKCPFSAHIRKTRPRADLGLPETNDHHVVRGGIPYGPEVTPDETASSTTEVERGLAFVQHRNGFQFLQQKWADNTKFVHAAVGFDPIIGAAQGAQRVVNGLDPTDPSRNITLTTGKLVTDFVVSRGGEYFFSPSLSAIANTLSV